MHGKNVGVIPNACIRAYALMSIFSIRPNVRVPDTAKELVNRV